MTTTQTTSTGRPAILDSVETLDIFSTPNASPVLATKLREGMVLLDPELGTPLYWLDHRMRAERRSGDVRWMVHNLDTGRIEEMYLSRRCTVPAMAA